MMWHDVGWGAWVGMSLGAVAFWVLVVWLAITVVRANGSNTAHNKTGSPAQSAEGILAERYARGDIDADSYHTRLEDLRGAHGRGARS